MSALRFRHAGALVAFTLASTLSLVSNAGSAYHPTPDEAGAVYHPQHASLRTRADVATELGKAQTHPAWNSVSRGAPWPAARQGEPKTRAQVAAELNAAMKHPAWNAVSRGAPWPAAR